MNWGYEFAGIKMSSCYYTIDIFSRIFSDNKQLKQIIEIGTFTGSLTIYLGIEGIRNDIPVTTVDIKRQHSPETQAIFNRLGVEFIEMDAYEMGNRETIFRMLDKPTFLFCDGGLKYEEFRMFVPKLPRNSIVAVHDFGTEFKEEHCRPLENTAIPIMIMDWENEDARTAIFKIK